MTSEHGLIAAGFAVACASGAFGLYMNMRNDGQPNIPGSQYLTVFAQLGHGNRPNPAVPDTPDRFGKAAQNSAWSLLRAGLVHVIASDGHDTEHRPPRLDYAREILIGAMGMEAASLLLVDNPGGIIAGEKIWMQAPAALPPKRKKWFFF